MQDLLSQYRRISPIPLVISSCRIQTSKATAVSSALLKQATVPSSRAARKKAEAPGTAMPRAAQPGTAMLRAAMLMAGQPCTVGRRGFPVSGFPPEKKGKKTKSKNKFGSSDIARFNFKKAGMISGIIAAAVIVLLLLFSSFYNVDEQHNAIVTQFGKVVRTDTAGLHFKIPLIQKVSMVDMTTHGVGIGYSDYVPDQDLYYSEEDLYYSEDGVDWRPASSDSYYKTNSVMITSDFNLLDIDFYLEYKVSDPVAYLYNSLSPEEILQNMAFAAIRSTVVNYTVDEAMTTGKSQIQAEIKEKLQQWLLDENIGMQVVNVQIQDAEPPTAEIQSAFKEVENAKQSKDTALNNARKYQNEQVPKAEAEADRIRQNAEATKASRIAEAEGQAARFNTMFEQYQANPLITRQRLFFEAMEEILPGKKVIFTDGNTQELLPIDSFGSFSGTAGGETNE